MPFIEISGVSCNYSPTTRIDISTKVVSGYEKALNLTGHSFPFPYNTSYILTPHHPLGGGAKLQTPGVTLSFQYLIVYGGQIYRLIYAESLVWGGGQKVYLVQALIQYFRPIV